MKQLSPLSVLTAAAAPVPARRGQHDVLTPRHVLRVVFHPPHLKRTCMVAVLVGVWLSVFNLGGQLLDGPWNMPLAIKVAMNLLTPFAVANLGLISHQAGPESDRRMPSSTTPTDPAA